MHCFASLSAGRLFHTFIGKIVYINDYSIYTHKILTSSAPAVPRNVVWAFTFATVVVALAPLV